MIQLNGYEPHDIYLYIFNSQVENYSKKIARYFAMDILVLRTQMILEFILFSSFCAI